MRKNFVHITFREQNIRVIKNNKSYLYKNINDINIFDFKNSVIFILFTDIDYKKIHISKIGIKDFFVILKSSSIFYKNFFIWFPEHIENFITQTKLQQKVIVKIIYMPMIMYHYAKSALKKKWQHFDMVMVYKLGNIFYKLHTRKGEINNFDIAYDEKISWQYPKMQTIKIIDGFTNKKYKPKDNIIIKGKKQGLDRQLDFKIKRQNFWNLKKYFKIFILVLILLNIILLKFGKKNMNAKMEEVFKWHKLNDKMKQKIKNLKKGIKLYKKYNGNRGQGNSAANNPIYGKQTDYNNFQ